MPGNATGNGRVEPGVLPGGRAAWTAPRAVRSPPAGPPRELYLTGPEVTDPTEIVTEVIAPLV